MGGACIGEDKLAPSLMRRARDVGGPSPATAATSSVFLAVQTAGGWLLASHLGRVAMPNSTP